MRLQGNTCRRARQLQGDCSERLALAAQPLSKARAGASRT